MIDREIHFHDRYGYYNYVKVPDGMRINLGDKVSHLCDYMVIVEVRHEIEDDKTIYIAKAQ